MEEFNNSGGGFFTVDEEEPANPFKASIDDDPNDSDPPALDRRETYVPPVTDAVKRQLKRQIYNPVTCKMFQESSALPDDIFYSDGLFFRDICIVGRVNEVTSTSKSMRVMIDDNRGSLEVTILYKDYESQPAWAKRIEQGSYYKFFGQAKIFKHSKGLFAVHANKITDFNEATHHSLMVMYNKCVREKGVLTPQEIKEGKRLAKKSNDDSYNTTTYEESKDFSEEVKSKPVPKATPEKSKPCEIKMHQLKDFIIKTIEEICEEKETADVNSIYKKLPVKVKRTMFDSAIAILADEMVVVSNDGNFSYSLV